MSQPCRRPRTALTLVETLVVIAICGLLMSLLLPAVQRVREAANRTRCSDQLRQIGLAAHNYHSARGAFPPGSESARQQFRYLTWLAHLLPYIEQDALWQTVEAAYREDSQPSHNPPHVGLSTVVPFFACPSDPRAGVRQQSLGRKVALTSYLGVSGTETAQRDGVFYLDSATRATDITDGTSLTLFAGERPPSPDFYFGWWYAGQGVDGSGTADMVLGIQERLDRPHPLYDCPLGPYSFRPGRPDEKCDIFHFWSPHPGGAHFLFADGSVRFLAYSISPHLRALATRNGGEVVDSP